MEKYSFMFGKNGSLELMNKNNLIGYIFQPKYSGIRVLVYKEGDNIQIIDRLQKDITFKFPEFLDIHYALKEDCVLDCEIIVLDDHKKESQELLEIRNLLNKKTDIDKVCLRFPAKLIILDILKKNDISLIERTLRDRIRILGEIFKEKNYSNLITISEQTLDGKELLNKIRNKDKTNLGYIGIFAKDLNSKYESGIRSWNWLKIEPRKLDNAVIIGYKRINANTVELLLGQYNPRFNSWKIIGKTEINEKERISNIIKTIKTKILEIPKEENEKKEKLEESPLLKEKFKIISPHAVIEIFSDNFEFFRIRIDKNPLDCIFE